MVEMKPLGAARQPCCRFSSNWPIASFLFLVLLYIYYVYTIPECFYVFGLFVFLFVFFGQFFSQMCLFLIKFLKQLIQHYILHVMFSFSLLLGSVFPIPLQRVEVDGEFLFNFVFNLLSRPFVDYFIYISSVRVI